MQTLSMMKFKLLFYALLLSRSLVAQKNNLSIELETGGTLFYAQTTDKSYFRKDVIYYEGSDYSQRVVSAYGTYFGGLKLQLQSRNERWKFSSGLRFIQTYGDLAKNSDPDYFYFLYQQTSSSLEYLRVKEITQTTNYVGLPLEARFFPFHKDNTVRLFFTAGTQIGYKLATKTKIIFADPNMNPLASAVQSKVEQPDDFSATVYGGAGLELHKPSIPVISVTVIFPSVMLVNHTMPATPLAGAGLQLSIQLPHKKSKQ